LDSELGIDRLALRARPTGLSLMHQNWGKLLFMHWPIDAEILRPLIPFFARASFIRPGHWGRREQSEAETRP